MAEKKDRGLGIERSATRFAGFFGQRTLQQELGRSTGRWTRASGFCRISASIYEC